MKKFAILGTGICLVLAFSSCKSSESAYKKAYEKAKQQEMAEPEITAPVEEKPVVAAPVQTPKEEIAVREEKVTVVTGMENGLKNYSVVCGSFVTKSNAEGLKDFLDGQGYSALVVFNEEKGMYRVIVSTFDDRESAASARDAFKAKYPNREDFQGSWLLYRLY